MSAGTMYASIKNRKLLSITNMDIDENILTKHEHEYDDNFKIIKSTSFYNNGTTSVETTEYDEKGNKIKGSITNTDSTGDSFIISISADIKYDIDDHIIYEKNTSVKSNDPNYSNTVEDFYEYDSHGNCTFNKNINYYGFTTITNNFYDNQNRLTYNETFDNSNIQLSNRSILYFEDKTIEIENMLEESDIAEICIFDINHNIIYSSNCNGLAIDKYEYNEDGSMSKNLDGKDNIIRSFSYISDPKNPNVGEVILRNRDNKDFSKYILTLSEDGTLKSEVYYNKNNSLFGDAALTADPEDNDFYCYSTILYSKEVK